MYEAYNNNVVVQFLSEQEATNYALHYNMSVRETIIDDFIVTPDEKSKEDWYNLEQSLYQHPDILPKALNSTGNGLTFLLKVLSDGKLTGASENALNIAFSVLLPQIPTLTEEEVVYINSKLEQFNFITRV